MADSWGLLAMMAFFVTAVLMLFRPGEKKKQDDASMIPFRNENLKTTGGIIASHNTKSDQFKEASS